MGNPEMYMFLYIRLFESALVTVKPLIKKQTKDSFH